MIERARNAFTGLAFGDAFGRTLEFTRGRAVREAAVDTDRLMWTDDTHMALYLAEAALAVGAFDEDAFGHAVGRAFAAWSRDPLTPSTAPGGTCLAGARAYGQGGDWRTSGVRASDGCGAVMRIAPLPMRFGGEALVAAARVSALVTHAHPNAVDAAVAGSVLLRAVLEDGALGPAQVERALAAIPAGLTADALRAALQHALGPRPDWLDDRSIPAGDGGWRSSSALGLAVLAALWWGDDVATCVEKAARIDGDSDSVAALAGMYAAAAGGALPAWRVPEQERIVSLAERLVAAGSTHAPGAARPLPKDGATPRTSASHPLYVDWVHERIGLTFAPGKKGPSALSRHPWDRDLAADLDVLRGQVDLLVSLVEDWELREYGIPDLVEQAERRGIAVLRVPVRDGGTPDPAEARATVRVAVALARAGRRVVFHCRGGLGRAGTFAACALVALGADPDTAIARTRAARKGAIENDEQAAFVRRFRP